MLPDSTKQLIYMSISTRNHIFQFDGWILRIRKAEMENVTGSIGFLHSPEADMTENNRTVRIGDLGIHIEMPLPSWSF